MGGGGVAEDLEGGFNRGAGGHGDQEGETGRGVAEGVVDDSSLKDDAVRDEDFDAIIAVELAAAGADRCDGAAEGADLDEVADSDRAFEQEDEAADEVVDELLGAEADRDGGCTAEQGENCKGNLDSGEGDEANEEEQGVVCEFLYDRAGGGVQIEAATQSRAQPAAEGGREDSSHQKDRQGGDEHSQCNRTGALDELAIHIDRVAESEERGFPNLDHASAEGVHGEVEEGWAG